MGRGLREDVPQREESRWRARARPPPPGAHLGHGPVRAHVTPEKPTEIDQFEKKFGYKPTQLRTSYDALAVYVNKDNPIEKATLAEIDGGSPRPAGRRQERRHLGQLGLTGDWASRPVSLYGRNSASGTTAFSRSTRWATAIQGHGEGEAGSASVVQGVTPTVSAWATAASATDLRREGRLAGREGGRRLLQRQLRDVVGNKYPLARFLYVYVNKAPGKELDPVCASS